MSSASTAPLMMQLVRNDAGLLSGSGSNPNRVRPAYWVEGMSSVLDRGNLIHGLTGSSIKQLSCASIDYFRPALSPIRGTQQQT
jgi:hypothetical protein